jgi:hypothetical protein
MPPRLNWARRRTVISRPMSLSSAAGRLATPRSSGVAASPEAELGRVLAAVLDRTAS